MPTDRRLAAALVAAAVGLGACGGSLQSALAPSTPAVESPAATEEAVPSATPVPSSVAVVQRFVDFVVRGHPTYHVDVTGRLLATISAASLKGSVDVSGLDVTTTTSYAFDHTQNLANTTVRTIWAKRAAYMRVGSGTWQRIAAGFGAQTVVDPFGGADAPGAVTYVSSAMSNGRTLSTLTVNAGRLFDLTTIPAPNLSEETVRLATWTLLVDDQGRPVSGTYRLDGVGRVGSQLQELVVELSAQFSKVGAAISIRAP